MLLIFRVKSLDFCYDKIIEYLYPAYIVTSYMDKSAVLASLAVNSIIWSNVKIAHPFFMMNNKQAPLHFS